MPPRPDSARILAVDDDEGVTRALERLFSRRGLPTAVASSAEEALALLEGGLAPAVVVSDQRMGGMDGVDFLAVVRRRWREVRRILMTSFSDPDDLLRAVNEAQVHRFLTKPWDPNVLVQVVEETLADYDLLEQLTALTGNLERQVEDRSKALSRAKADWLRTVDAIADPLTLISTRYVIGRANIVLAQATGIPIQRIVGRKCWEIVVSGTAPCEGCPVPSCIVAGGRQEGEIRDPASGSVYRVIAYPVSREDGRVEGVVCTYRDVTDERELQQRLVQSERMVAIGTLAGGVAHEINNPLGGILAWTQLLMRTDGLDEEAVSFLKEIEESALRCKKIVRGLLDFSRNVPSEERAPVGLNDVVERARFLMKHTFAKQGVDVVFEPDPDLRQVTANANQLQQVLVNLLSNACGAIDGTGRITVRTRNVGAEVLLEVEDDGCGIPAEARERIFMPFYTTKPQGEGTGLGLAVTYGIVESHAGTISFETEEGVGTTFALRLPVMRTHTPYPGIPLP